MYKRLFFDGKNQESSQERHPEDEASRPLIGYYGYWVILTYLSIISAVFGIHFAFAGNVRNAVICMMVSGLCDTFDGRVAGLKKRNRRELNYGVQIDAMADLTSFGVLPAAIGCALWHGGSFGMLNAFVAAVYVLAALIRLSYFNATEAEMHEKNEKRTYFEGLPTTSAALLIPFVYSVCHMMRVPLDMVYGAMLTVIAVLFVVRIQIPKPQGRAQIVLCVIGLPVITYILFFGGR